MPDITLKSVAEIKAMLRVTLHNGAGRYVKQHNVPCPENCAHAPKLGKKVLPCSICGAQPGHPCNIESQFKPRYTFEELKQMFKELLQNREWLLRNDRGVAMLLWVMNQLTPEEEPDPAPLPPEKEGSAQPNLWFTLSGNTITISPDALPFIQDMLKRISEVQEAPHA